MTIEITLEQCNLNSFAYINLFLINNEYIKKREKSFLYQRNILFLR